jgi:hypothetical protein
VEGAEVRDALEGVDAGRPPDRAEGQAEGDEGGREPTRGPQAGRQEAERGRDDESQVQEDEGEEIVPAVEESLLDEEPDHPCGIAYS